MQWLAEVCVKRPVFTWVLVVSLVVIGAASFTGLGVDRFPNIDFPVVIITTSLPGAAPEQIETEVTEPIEEAVNAISGLDDLTSNSYEGLSVVIARFTLEKDVGEASEEIRDRLQRVLPQLPADVDQPRVERIDPDATPVLQVAVRSRRSVRETTDFADRVIRRRLESMPGVGGVTISGGREREIQVVVDPTRMAAAGVTPRDVQRALVSENAELPGGNIEAGNRTIQLRVQGRLTSAAEFGQVPVATRADRVIRIADVADVLDTEEDPVSQAILNGDNVVLVSVRKQSGSNTVAVVDALRDRVAEIRAEVPPSYQLEIVRDESEFIRNSIHAVEEHLIVGGLLAALVVLLFLGNARSTIIAALAIPSSIIATFALIKALGLTLNMITLLGLTLSVGIVIDDAIVVLENIVRFIEERGMSPKRAAVLATKEIGLAVLATSLSLVAVFLPIAFMGGIVGRFMGSFGYTMSFAIMVSLFISFTLTPMLCARWLKPKRRAIGETPQDVVEHVSDAEDVPDPVGAGISKAEERARYSAWRENPELVRIGHAEGGRLYRKLEAWYLRLLAWSMAHRGWIAGLLVVVVASTVPMMAMVAKNFLPREDESRFEINIRAPEGTSLNQTRIIAERVASQVRGLDGVERTLVTVGSPPGDPSGRGVNQAAIYVGLAAASDRAGSQDDLIGQVREQVLPRFADEHLRTVVGEISPFGGSGMSAAPIQYVLSGPDLAKLTDYASRLLTVLREVPGVSDPDMSLVPGRPSFEVRIDRPRAADLGVQVADIANALRLTVGGAEVSNFNEGGERYDVRIRANLESRNRPEVIEQLRVPTATGGTVRLSDVASLVPSTGPASIQHLGRQRQVTVYCNLAPGSSEASIVAALDRARDNLNMEPGYRGRLTGRSKELASTMRGFLFAVVMSFVFMYLVLSAQFESWIHPVTIMSSLPLTLPFAVFSLLVTRQSLNIYSMLGVLVLFGIVKKNSILQVDHIRELRRKGMSRADAVMLGNRDRLRPILMTTLAFVAGMVPLLISTGAGAGTNRSIGWIIAGGQTLSLLLTLLATPVIYSWLDDLSAAAWIGRVRDRVGDGIAWVESRFERTQSHHDPAE